MAAEDFSCGQIRIFAYVDFAKIMDATTTHTTASPNITQEEWDWVSSLISDVKRSELQDAFAEGLGQWDLAVRQFRKVEQKRLLLGKPTQKDLHYHAVCLHGLLLIGHSFALQATQFNEKELEGISVRHSQIEAYISELEQSLREWHHGFSEAEVETAKRKIFSATA